MIRILVTGGGGFIGGYIYRYLQSLGFEVYNYDLVGQNDKYHICASILDYPAVKKAVEMADIVFHFAGFSNINLVKAAPKDCIELNMMGSTNFLEAIRLKNNCRFVYASSVYIHSRNGHLYTTSKLATEYICHNYADLYGIYVTILRLGTVYGEKSRHEDVVSIFARQAMEEGQILIHGSGKQKRHFIHGNDVAKACHHLINRELRNKVLILASNEGTSIAELAKIVQSIRPDITVRTETNAREDDYKGDIGDIEETNRLLDWKAEICIEEGMRRMMEYFTCLKR